METLDSGNDDFPSGLEKLPGHFETDLEIKQGRSHVRWTVGLVVRLCIWYMLLTPFLRCPSRLSGLTDSSPWVCKPYIVARSCIEPRLQPYYDAYAAPYVDLARPYVKVLNEQVYSPTVKVAKKGYDIYGAPALERAEKYGYEKWESHVAPQLESTKESLHDAYKATVGPYVQRAGVELSPYYRTLSDYLSRAYLRVIEPLYAHAGPFIGKTYTSGQDMLATTVLPHVGGLWSSTVYFVNNSLWPIITGLYSRNVEPQLVKIGQKLASYKEGKRLRPVVDETESLFEPQVPATVSKEAVHEPEITSQTLTQETASTKRPFSPSDRVGQSREETASALQEWQKRFTAAAGKGAEDLRERVTEIVDGNVARSALSHGANLVLELENAVGNELSAIKLRINASIESLPFEEVPAEEEKKVQDDLNRVVKEAAIAIRDRTHALREWYNSFDQDLTDRVSAAIDSTLHVLNSIRDLGLQDVGMRWARTDGVTFEDWGRYHAIKSQFDDWRDEVRLAGLQHERLDETRTLASEILDHGMDIAKAAARELPRLRDVGIWKIAARELSDNFETRFEPPPLLPKPVDGSDQESNDTISTSYTVTLETSPDFESPHVTLDADSTTAEDEILGTEFDETVSVDNLIPTQDQHPLHEEAEPTQEPTLVPSTAPTEEVFESTDVPNHLSENDASQAPPEHTPEL